MRVRNKELRQQRHRKEQRIKELIKEAKSTKTPKAKGTSAKPAKTVEPKAPKKVVAKAPAEKPKKAVKPKATEEPVAEPVAEPAE